jgi:hypothetical protein
MKKVELLSVILISAFLFSSCQAIGDIFKAGMWVGIIVVVVIVALVLWLIGKARR